MDYKCQASERRCLNGLWWVGGLSLTIRECRTNIEWEQPRTKESWDRHDQKQKAGECDCGRKENKLLKHAVVNQVDFWEETKYRIETNKGPLSLVA